jgi:uncharacterized protein (DUF1015 family)
MSAILAARSGFGATPLCRRSIPGMTEPVHENGRARPLHLAPFRALRYSPDVVSDLAAVTCPPYDVIGENGVAEWEAADPHNVVRLILPRSGPREDRYTHAARDLRSWLDHGVLRSDDSPALYVYEHASGDANARGLVGAVSLHEPAEHVVLPHEDVFPGPVDDRAALMAATGAQLEPILLTYGGGGAASAAVDRALATDPDLEVTTADGAMHRIWALTGPSTVEKIQADLAGRQALIADGHHRYAAYRALRDRITPGTVTSVSDAAQHGLAMLVDADRHPLRLGSIHRSIAGLSLPEAVAAAAGGFRTVSPLPPDVEPARALATTGQNRHAFVVSDGRQSALLEHPISERVDASLPPGRSATWRRLDASIACEFMLPQLFRVDDTDSRVAYHHDAAEAVLRAHRLGGVALLIRPPSHTDVLAIAANRERMPRKSTSFGPKPRTGLLMRLLRDPRL